MRKIVITRINPETGQVETPHLYRDSSYRLGDPSYGTQRHLKRFELHVHTLEEVLDHVQRKFSVRMSTRPGSAGPSQIIHSKLKVCIDGIRI